jgi:hypothetical protein
MSWMYPCGDSSSLIKATSCYNPTMKQEQHIRVGTTTKCISETPQELEPNIFQLSIYVSQKQWRTFVEPG